MSWDAISFFEDNGIEYFPKSKHGGKDWINIRCPLCADSADHGRFHTQSGKYHCWRCPGAAPQKVIQTLLSTSYAKSKELWDSYHGVQDIVFEEDKVEHVSYIKIPGTSLQGQHKLYLKDRGFVPEHLESIWKIRGTGITGEWRNRLIMPFFHNGKPLTFQSRSVRVKDYKCLAPAASVRSMKELLYGEWLMPSFKQIGVCEGPFDIYRMGPGFVATCGIGHTEHQVQRLLQYGIIYIVYDPEPGAQERAEELGKDLAAFGKHVEIIDIEGKVDPGALPEEKAMKIRGELGFEKITLR